MLPAADVFQRSQILSWRHLDSKRIFFTIMKVLTEPKVGELSTGSEGQYLPHNGLGNKFSMTLLVAILCIVMGIAVGMGNGVIFIGLFIAILGVLVVMERPMVGILALVTFVPALASLDRGLPVPGLRFSEVLIIGIAVTTLVTIKQAPWAKFDWVVLAYVSCTLGFGILDLSEIGVSLSLEALGKLIGPLEFLLLYRTVLVYSKRATDRRMIIRWMLIGSVPVSILAVFQFVNVPGTRALAVTYAGVTDNSQAYHTFYRATALFAQGHLLGGYLMIVALLGVALLLDSRTLPLSRRTLVGIVILDGVALLSTATVTPILGFIGGVFLLAYWYGRLSRVLVAAMVIGVIAAIVFGSTFSARYSQEDHNAEANGGAPVSLTFRWQLWTKQYLPTIDQHLVTGYGPELPPGAVWKYTESVYISLLLRGGIPLLFLFAWLMWIMARRSLAIDDDRRPLARTMFVVILVLIPMHTQANYFIDAGLPQVWWAFAGLLFAGATAGARNDLVCESRNDVRQIEARKEVPTTPL